MIVIPHNKGVVLRDFVICFLVSFDRSEVSTHKELAFKISLSCRGAISFKN
jgi:hypothetical protein